MLVLLVVSGALTMWWAIRYQRQVLEVIAMRRPVATREVVRAGAPAPRREASRLGATPARTWAGSWTDSCTVTAALAMAGTALVAGRHCDDGDDFTLVLLIGNDGRAVALMQLLDGWVRRGVAVRLHPAARAGTVELLDERGNAVRARLLAT